MPKPKEKAGADATVELTLNDFLRASFWFLLQRRMLLFSLCLPVPAAYVMIRNQGSVNLPVVLTLLGIFVIFWGTLYLSLRHQFGNIPPEKRNYQFLFYADFVLMKSSVGESKLLWPAFVRLAESKHYLYLFVQKRLFHIIPKSCLSAAELAWLRAVAKEKIGTAASENRT